MAVDSRAAEARTTAPTRLVPLALRARVLAAIRAGLSAVGLAASVLVGVVPETALLGWTVGAFLVSIVLAGDRRGAREADPEPVRGEIVPESWAQIARTDVFPSTVGVATMTIVALAFEPTLAAMLAGILGGMALMTIVSGVAVAVAERRLGGPIYLDRGTRRLSYRKPPVP